MLGATGHPNRLSTLAEISFGHAARTGDRRYFLAAAAYAYAYLFAADGPTRPNEYSPLFRLACDLYNRGIAEGLTRDSGHEVDLASGTRDLPFGTLTIDANPTGFSWSGFTLGPFASAADYRVRGLVNRYRRPGIGASLVAGLTRDRTVSASQRAFIARGWKVPVTALLRFDDARASLASGILHARLDLFAENVADRVEIGSKSVPLEYEPSSALAHTLEGSRIWEFELAGFFATQMGLKQKSEIVFVQPHRKGRIPVVLVHGTASSIGRWADVVNELQADETLRDRIEPWLFTYHTGNPIAVSAGELRRGIRDAVARLDPEGRDPALRRMVVIGHSQGGLLAKMTVLSSGDALWRLASSRSYSEIADRLRPETRRVVEQALFFDPSPSVARVVFVATPHRGSDLVGGFVQAVMQRLISLPLDLLSAGSDLQSALLGDPDARLHHAVDGLPRSTDQMSAGNPFLETLLELPMSPSVVTHSIIATDGEGRLQDLGDGVVRYDSAHLDGVASELVVRSGHSTQSHPQTILELRRILREHLAIENASGEP
jgi:pimeloyl-ACP methyl ester carboxylesterase